MNFIIYDLEATCWMGRPPGGHNEVIEIGAYKVNQYGETVGEFSAFVKPIVNPELSSFCKKLTSITQAQVDAASRFNKVIERFQDWINLDEDYLLGAWGKMDVVLLRNDHKLHKMDHEWLDHNTNLKQQYHEINGVKKYTGLKSTLKREGFEFDGQHHRAIADAHNLCKIFKKYIDEWVY